jgi:hypothetical protein
MTTERRRTTTSGILPAPDPQWLLTSATAESIEISGHRGCTSRAGGATIAALATAGPDRRSRIAWTGGVMYAVVTDVPAPLELYDAAHAAVGRHSGAKIDGLLVHSGGPHAPASK